MSVPGDAVRLADQLAAVQGDSGHDRRRRYSELATSFLQDSWGENLSGSALGLVGSFARGRAGPRSDLDVVVLLSGHGGGNSLQIQGFVQTLWDSGLGVDHSVRTPEQCQVMAAKDLPVLTGLLDIRHVAGDPLLTAQTSALVLASFRKSARRRVDDLLSAAEARWGRFDQLDRLNEPDLKNSAGGLRDVGLLRALQTSWLADFPHNLVPQAESTILDIRDALHLVTGRHTSQLFRVFQAEVAELAGYEDETAMMRALRESAEVVDAATQKAGALARSAQKAWGPMGMTNRIIRPTIGRRKPLPGGGTILDEYLLEAGGALGFRKPNYADNPDRVLDLAVASAIRNQPISVATLEDLSFGPQEFAWNHQRLERFIALIGAGAGLRATWRQLDQVGIPAWWIPELAPLRGRPQNASFHQWTVDRHLIETVVQIQDRTRPALLAALLHDIGKQPPDGGINHAAHGKVLAAGVLARMPLEETERLLIVDLVENHLLLAHLATEADPDDPATVDTLLDACHRDGHQLSLLAALTRADSQGAGPKAWTPWRQALIEGLVDRAIMRNGSD